ncbi:hypothetical protein HYPSUDRAFT_537795 [Hypholoma sublateritium FD-334 SS-4]|uniref:Uncharacterized protein n=1 Tax=Hypholoma sublateritium (strain FD-334 SS-4) TaxID=945553 RepID=A0A0D2PXV4_HYPSF|nr:hypothetical protein HYPSUDRAFT_537795 [Hypholoma sublateritium FD-334 SS-4]
MRAVDVNYSGLPVAGYSLNLHVDRRALAPGAVCERNVFCSVPELRTAPRLVDFASGLPEDALNTANARGPGVAGSTRARAAAARTRVCAWGPGIAPAGPEIVPGVDGYGYACSPPSTVERRGPTAAALRCRPAGGVFEIERRSPRRVVQLGRVGASTLATGASRRSACGRAGVRVCVGRPKSGTGWGGTRTKPSDGDRAAGSPATSVRC